VQGLLSIVAGLGITNTLRELFIEPPKHIRLTSFLCWQPSCEKIDLGLDLWIVPVVVALLEIIIAFRFYQSSSIQIEDSYPSLPCLHLHHYLPALPADPSPEDIQRLDAQRQQLRHQLQRRQTHFMWHTIGFITEGIMGIRVKRDRRVPVVYAEGLNSAKSAVPLQSTDRHGIWG